MDWGRSDGEISWSWWLPHFSAEIAFPNDFDLIDLTYENLDFFDFYEQLDPSKI